jgi:DUF1680 family protein
LAAAGFRNLSEGAMDNSKYTEFVDLKNIVVSDSFWSPFMDRIRTTVIPYQWEALNDRYLNTYRSTSGKVF